MRKLLYCVACVHSCVSILLYKSSGSLHRSVQPQTLGASSKTQGVLWKYDGKIVRGLRHVRGMLANISADSVRMTNEAGHSYSREERPRQFPQTVFFTVY